MKVRWDEGELDKRWKDLVIKQSPEMKKLIEDSCLAMLRGALDMETKTVKIEEAIAEYRKSGRKCTYAGEGTKPENYGSPFEWINAQIKGEHILDCNFELEPSTPKVVEFELSNNELAQQAFNHWFLSKLVGKRWRVVCTELREEGS